MAGNEIRKDKVLDHHVGVSTQVVKTFTDKQLFDLFGKLKNSYRQDETFEQNYDRMRMELFAEFLPGGLYGDMPESEQKKIDTVFTTFLKARSLDRSDRAYTLLPFQRRLNGFRAAYRVAAPRPIYVVHHYHYQPSYWFNDYFFWYWVCSGHSSQQSNSDDFLKCLLILFVVLIALIVLYFAACYLFTAIAESLERFWHNEGCLQASLSLLGVVTGAVTGAMLLMTALPPFGALAILCIASASIVAAAITAGLTNVIQGARIEAMNSDALDSTDPHRFALTGAESIALENKGIDPIKVKSAIAALRHEIEEFPSVSSRWFSDAGRPKQERLQKIRALRRGELFEVSVDQLHFDLRCDDRLPLVAQDENVPFGLPIGFPDKRQPEGYLPQ